MRQRDRACMGRTGVANGRYTHLCAVRVTHTKNTICPRAREEASDIIHAEGVRFAVPSSAPLARKVLTLRKDIRVPMKTANCPSSAGAGPHVSCPLAKTALAGGKSQFTWPWCWVTFGEQSMVISRARAEAEGTSQRHMND